VAETRTAYVRRVQRREPVHEAREKWTLKKLFKETIRFSKNRRRYSSSGRTRLVKVIPYVGTKTAVIHLESFGVTSKAIHQIFISFHGLHITERVMGAGYFRVQYGGDDYWIRKPDISKDLVRVRCSCKDFFFTFALWNFRKNALFGVKPRSYTRKTTTRPPRNPKKIPGLCKHLVNASLWLRRKGYVIGQRLS